MSQYYAYDTDGDGRLEDCAELGPIEADSMEDAVAFAADFWPDVASILVLRL